METLERFAIDRHANGWDFQGNLFTKDLISACYGDSAHFVFAARLTYRQPSVTEAWIPLPTLGRRSEPAPHIFIPVQPLSALDAWRRNLASWPSSGYRLLRLNNVFSYMHTQITQELLVG